jgi:Fe2+ transport system protein B
MGKVGLSARFIPLLSSFACAIPGIMATRTIANWKDRLATIMVAPLMTCSARLPVYALLIGAFVPASSVGPFNVRGLTLFGLYVAGVVSAMAVAWVLKRTWSKRRYQPLMLELPPYRMPSVRNIGLGLGSARASSCAESAASSSRSWSCSGSCRASQRRPRERRDRRSSTASRA